MRRSSGRNAAILQDYLPRPLSEAELRASIDEIVAACPSASPKAMGQVMAALKARHGDALDSRAASASGAGGVELTSSWKLCSLA